MIGRTQLAASLGSGLILMGAFFSVTADAAGEPPRPLATKQPFFSIPFYLNPNVPPPSEVVLHVSGDQGKKWTLYQRRRPDQGRFDFQAGADGEYWFVVRTSLDTPPAGEMTKPEKIVVVDRQPPELKMDVSRNDLGQIRARWSAEDPRLDPNTFSLEYRATPEDAWQPVTIDLPEPSTSPKAIVEGQVTWTIRQTDSPVEVRAQVSDQAGNRQEWLAPVTISTAPSPSVPVGTPSAAEDGSRSVQQEISDIEQRTPEWMSQGSPMTSAGADLRWRSGVSASPVGAAPVASPAATSSPSPMTTPASSRTSSSELPAVPESATRAQREIRWTKATRIELDYDVADTSDGGLARVELWMTTDEGFTWNAHGVDEDLTSPFLVDLPQDGLFGFKLLIHDKQGRSAPAPSAGDDADLWIGLDRVSPQVRITDAKASESGEVSSVQLTWSAVDNHLGRSPVQILYGPSPEGPWATLAENLPNQGHYEGQTATRLPARTYLKIEVRDEAGNLGEAQSPEPVGQPERPRGIIRGFKPLSFLPRSFRK